jgi:hypothetical protein
MTLSNKYILVSGGIWRLGDAYNFEGRGMKYRIGIAITLVLLCWVPLCFFSLAQLGWSSFYSFFIKDIHTHVRFLFVLPILLFARLPVNRSFTRMVEILLETKLVDKENIAEFEKTINWLNKWRKSITADLVLLALVYLQLYMVRQGRINSQEYFTPWSIEGQRIDFARWWYILVSFPILQIIIFRWMYTIILWIIFLWKLARINLHATALHPDGNGGLAFMNYVQLSFLPVAVAFSALIAAGLNNLMIFAKITPYDYGSAIGSALISVLLIFILPLLVFVPLLARVKRKTTIEYASEAWGIVTQYRDQLRDFVKKEDVKPDTSWHVDLCTSYEYADKMNIVLINKRTLLGFIVAVLLPFIPVVLQDPLVKDLLVSMIKNVIA